MIHLFKKHFAIWATLFFITASCSSEKEAYVPFSKAEDSTFVYQNYTKQEVYIPMRDGTKLFTAIYTPKDQREQYPIIMYRTPYSVQPYGEDNYKIDLGPNMRMTRDKYIFIYQDVRGAYMSEGHFVNMTPQNRRINESTDTFDTIEWLLTNVKNHNGKVGQWGISYPGFYTAAGMINSHPSLVAASPQAPIADWFFDDFHHHGAFFLPHTFNFFASFGQPKKGPTKIRNPRFQHGTNDGYAFFKEMTPLSLAKEYYLGDSIAFWNEIVAHPNYDSFWQDRNLLPHLKNIHCAVLTVGGWFDAEDLYGPLKIYETIEQNNPDISNTIVMGPWSHGGWRRTAGDHLGNVHFGSKTSNFYNDQIITPFFAYHLKGKEEEKLPEAYMFQTGTNEWKKFEEWPPKNIEKVKYYFKVKKGLSRTPAKENEYGTDIFESDPANPVPFIDYEDTGMPKTYMTDDQGFLLDRPDVLYYLSEPMEEDLTIAGPILAHLIAKTNQTAADWIVKLIDVYPMQHPPFPHQPKRDMGRYHQMVRSEAIRGRFRESYQYPKPFEPKKSETIDLPLLDVLHTFKKGHRIMVQVQSSWFPLVDINPQTYVENIFEAEPEDFVKAQHYIGRSGLNPSYIELGILQEKEEK
ncbi:CocE/NonD family hydrolase [Reichenbachiella carrageenanivorans]|uniref:CocE/NonD family hydrolase n=1 Tax=Reichenbachiella carrageenanivorans TaxID=2979869 RepID=A0ABY6CV65_9BACT|nr:CocE/NonD family hydrolase [Reichenbachiella carrageenanivorans]UXX77811.1 CocE/NonD family hydrolase [Reichenbachiella carrageenanivorans]